MMREKMKSMENHILNDSLHSNSATRRQGNLLCSALKYSSADSHLCYVSPTVTDMYIAHVNSIFYIIMWNKIHNKNQHFLQLDTILVSTVCSSTLPSSLHCVCLAARCGEHRASSNHHLWRNHHQCWPCIQPTFWDIPCTSQGRLCLRVGNDADPGTHHVPQFNEKWPTRRRFSRRRRTCLGLRDSNIYVDSRTQSRRRSLDSCGHHVDSWINRANARLVQHSFHWLSS